MPSNATTCSMAATASVPPSSPRQLPVEHWHEVIGDHTLADAILDRIVHSAYRITLKGESMRKRDAKLTVPIPSE
jgi:hypothetical protein